MMLYRCELNIVGKVDKVIQEFISENTNEDNLCYISDLNELEEKLECFNSRYGCYNKEHIKEFFIENNLMGSDLLLGE